ncbi:MAG: heavy metal-binding domain-containing protein [Polyangia bacterium]
MIATRLLLVAIAAGGLVVAVVARRVGNVPAAAAASARPSFVCPMHPEVTSSSPGDCPICRMRLEPMANVATAEPAALQLATVEKELRAFDAVSRVKRFETAQEMRFPAWAESRDTGVALMYVDQAKLLVRGEGGQFWPLTGPTDGAPVRFNGEPPEPWDESTVRVRFHAAQRGTLPAGGTGSVKFATRLREDLVIREGAVLRSPEGPYVLVAVNDRHTLIKRPVEIGSVVYGYAAVVSGLHEDEWVVAKHTFALDTARRLGWRESP